MEEQKFEFASPMDPNRFRDLWRLLDDRIAEVESDLYQIKTGHNVYRTGPTKEEQRDNLADEKRAIALLSKLQGAQGRLLQNGYGYCEFLRHTGADEVKCGNPIEIVKLLAFPFTKSCHDCDRRERQARQQVLQQTTNQDHPLFKKS